MFGCYSDEVAALAVPVDLSPWSFRALLERLPARERAQLAWFLPQLRTTFLDPLVAILDEAELRRDFDTHLLAFIRVHVRLRSALARLLREDSLAAAISALDEDTLAAAHDTVDERLGPRDPIAADALRETYGWFVELLPVFVEHMPADVPERIEQVAEDEILDEVQRELETPAASLLRAEALMLAALIAVDDEDAPLPPLLGTWCTWALDETRVFISVLRKDGVQLVGPRIPGFTHKQWRERWADRVLDNFDDDDLAAFDAATRRLPSRRVG